MTQAELAERLREIHRASYYAGKSQNDADLSYVAPMAEIIKAFEQLNGALTCPRCDGTGKVVAALSPYSGGLTVLDCGECGDVRQAARG